jgi:hypothetical protein
MLRVVQANPAKVPGSDEMSTRCAQIAAVGDHGEMHFWVGKKHLPFLSLHRRCKRDEDQRSF